MQRLMHPQLKDLVDLQEQDLRLLDLRAQLAAFPRRFAELDARLAEAKATVEKARDTKLNATKERRKFEQAVEQCKDRIQKYRNQTSQVKTNEAYKALQHEIETAERDLSAAEDRLLEEMVAAEEYDRQIQAAEQAAREIEAAARSERGAAEKERAALEEEAARHEAQRKLLVVRIPEDRLDHYIRIAKRHGGIALAQVREQGNDQACAMCGVRILPHVFEEIRKGDFEEMIHCETCTRILYYVEPPPAPAPPSTGSAGASAESKA
jgi:uncharacterized protein